MTALAPLRYDLMINSERPEVVYYARDPDGQWNKAVPEDGEHLPIHCPRLVVELGLDLICDGVVWPA